MKTYKIEFKITTNIISSTTIKANNIREAAKLFYKKPAHNLTAITNIKLINKPKT